MTLPANQPAKKETTWRCGNLAKPALSFSFGHNVRRVSAENAMVENMVDLVARVSARASDIQGAKQLSQVDKTWLERMTMQHSGSQVWADVDKRKYSVLANRFLSGK